MSQGKERKKGKAGAPGAVAAIPIWAAAASDVLQTACTIIDTKFKSATKAEVVLTTEFDGDLSNKSEAWGKIVERANEILASDVAIESSAVEGQFQISIA